MARLIFLFLSFLFLNFSLQKLFAKEVFLPIGGSKVLKVSPLYNVHVSNGKVIKVRDLENKVLIYAKKSGQSSITSGKHHYNIHVLKKKSFHIFNQIKTLFKTFKGLNVKVIQDQIVVGGELLRISDWIRLSQLFIPVKESQKEPLYFFKAKMSSQIKEAAHKFFQTKMHSLGRLWSFSYLNLEDYFIELSEGEKKNRSFWIKNFHSFGLPIIFSNHKVRLSPMVRVQIYIAEMSKSWQRQFGFQWPETLQAQILPFQLSQENLKLKLQSLENKGEGRILTSPSLVCQSGSQARFLAGGELPIKTSSQYSSQVVWKPHGVLLTIKPLAEASGHMSVAITAEISLLDHGQSVHGIPALKTNRVSSHFNLKKKGTIVLSGLFLHDFGQSSDQTPYLSSIPLLGSLFKSKSFRDQKSELVIFVSPEVVQEAHFL